MKHNDQVKSKTVERIRTKYQSILSIFIKCVNQVLHLY